jgi:23S rRNA pseudouridine2605 synthase
MMRLQRYLAHAGVASRRQAERYILAGRVAVAGKVERVLGTLVDDDAQVTVDGRSVQMDRRWTYLVAHKPFGVVTTLHDPEGRRTIRSLLPAGKRLYPVGRLDYDTAGLLLLTDDGALTQLLTHPSFGVEKTYRATVRGRLDPERIAELRAGLALEDGRTEPALVRIVAANRDRSIIDLTIHEGKNRQVRRMLERLGRPVLTLTRFRFGPLSLGDLPMGGVRELSKRESHALKRISAMVGRIAGNEDE